MKRIYLDYAATTPVDLRVKKAMEPYLSEEFGNSMSLHFFGQEAKMALEEIINSEEESVVVDKRNPGCAKCRYYCGELQNMCAIAYTETYRIGPLCAFRKEEKEIEKYDPVQGFGKRLHVDYAIPDEDNSNGGCPYFDLKVTEKTTLERITSWIKKLFVRS